MKINKLSLSIIIPALNEEKNILNVFTQLKSCLEQNGIEWEVILVNDCSSDSTGEIIEKICRDNKNCKFIHNKQNKNIGGCFKEGLKLCTKEAVTWFPADGENNPMELTKYLFLLNYVDIIIPFTVNKGVRSFIRRILSSIYLSIINLSFGTSFNYTNGNIIYKHKVTENINLVSDGFFFQTELLIKAIRKNNLFAEVPIKLSQRELGESKAISLKNFIKIVKDYIRLFISVQIIHKRY